MVNNILAVNGINICYETFGQKSDPAILLIMGNSAQAIMWPEDFCVNLADNKYYVIRFDNRDTGLSTCVDYDQSQYDLFDLAKDAIGLLDGLNIDKAHVVGLSMGGSIAQLLAIYHSDRVLSLTSMMSSPDLSIKNDAFQGRDVSHAKLPAPKLDYITNVLALNKTQPNTRDEKIKMIVANWRLANGNKAPFIEEYWYQLIEATMEREEANPSAKNVKFATQSNHSQAQMATTEPNIDTLKLISVPTLVIHGQEDPLFPAQHAISMAEIIPNSKLLLIDKMGHALNPIFVKEITQAILTTHLANLSD